MARHITEIYRDRRSLNLVLNAFPDIRVSDEDKAPAAAVLRRHHDLLDLEEEAIHLAFLFNWWILHTAHDSTPIEQLEILKNEIMSHRRVDQRELYLRVYDACRIAYEERKHPVFDTFRLERVALHKRMNNVTSTQD